MRDVFLRSLIRVLGAAIAGTSYSACSSSSGTPSHPATAGSDAGTSGADGGTASFSAGTISVSQGELQGNFIYDVTASFVRNAAAGTSAPCPNMMSLTMGACIASIFCVPPDTGVATPAFTVLNAGTITVAGARKTVMLTYGQIVATLAPMMGYSIATGDTQFFAGGDMIIATSAGGPDLPAFDQIAIAPNNIVVTSPACTVAGCPDVDRTNDLVVTWTGGGAGTVFVTFESLSAQYVSGVSCSFTASAGTGTVPAALLAKLEKAGDPNIVGVFAIGPINETKFMVGDVPTRLHVQGPGLSGSLIISN
jgi:hypothetical protein